jgi:hypothetical protein
VPDLDGGPTDTAPADLGAPGHGPNRAPGTLLQSPALPTSVGPGSAGFGRAPASRSGAAAPTSPVPGVR